MNIVYSYIIILKSKIITYFLIKHIFEHFQFNAETLITSSKIWTIYIYIYVYILEFIERDIVWATEKARSTKMHLNNRTLNWFKNWEPTQVD